MPNRVALTKAITVESVNGPEHTFIVGDGPLGQSAVRCAYLADGAVLVGFTLTGGYTHITGDRYFDRSGGGVFLHGGGGGGVSPHIASSWLTHRFEMLC